MKNKAHEPLETFIWLTASEFQELIPPFIITRKSLNSFFEFRLFLRLSKSRSATPKLDDGAAKMRRSWKGF